VFNRVPIVALWRLVRTARVVAFVRGEASIEGSQQCVCAIPVPTLAVLPSLFAYSIPIGSPYFVMSMHMCRARHHDMQTLLELGCFAPPKRLLVNFPPLSELGPPRLLLELFAPPLSTFAIQAK
jgi:hypothetical protein